MSTFLLASLLFFTTPLKPSYTKEEIRKEYDKIVRLNYVRNEQFVYPQFAIDTNLPAIFKSFAEENNLLIDYLLTNYPQVAYEYSKRMKLGLQPRDIVVDSARMADIMFERLLPLLANYLQDKGSKIETYEPWKRPEISMDRLAGNAAKFFFPDSVTPEGNIASHICVAFNGFRDLEDVRSVMMEAFCWSVIQPLMFVDKSPLISEFSSALHIAGELQLSSVPDTKLKRYQGAVWVYMSQSILLRELLIAEYEKKKHLLTFTLKPE